MEDNLKWSALKVWKVQHGDLYSLGDVDTQDTSFSLSETFWVSNETSMKGRLYVSHTSSLFLIFPHNRNQCKIHPHINFQNAVPLFQPIWELADKWFLFTLLLWVCNSQWDPVLDTFPSVNSPTLWSSIFADR